MKTWKKVCLISLLSLLALFLFVSCGEEKEPRDRLETYLTALQKGDIQTAKQYEINITTFFHDGTDRSRPQKVQDAQAEVFRTLYQQMRYEILDFEKAGEEEFRFQVKFSAVDLPAVSDGLVQPLEEKTLDLLSLDRVPNADETQELRSENSIWLYHKLTELLKQKDCKRIEQTASVRVQLRKDQGWMVMADDQVVSAIWGCKASNASKNMWQLVDDAENKATENLIKQGKKDIPVMLESVFSALKVYDMDQAAKSMDGMVLFEESNDSAKALNEAVLSRMTYQLQPVTGDNPFQLTAHMRITAVDLSALGPEFAKGFVRTIVQAEAQGWDQQKVNAGVIDALIHCIKNPSAKTGTTEAAFRVVRTQNGWVMIPDEALTNALLGGHADQIDQNLQKDIDRALANMG